MFLWVNVILSERESLVMCLLATMRYNVGLPKRCVVKTVLYVFICVIWKLRNEMVFGDIFPSHSVLFDSIIDFFMVC